MKKKIEKVLKECKSGTHIIIKGIKKYFKSNILFTVFVIAALVNSMILRAFTVKSGLALSPFLADLAFVLAVGAFGYLIKPKHRYKYYFTFTIIFTAICMINSMYYTNYSSFVSVSLIATSMQLVGVSEALENVIQFHDFIYLWALFAMWFANKKLKSIGYYDKTYNKAEGKLSVLKTLLAACITLGFFLSTVTGTDLSRLYKQWNREYVVMKFGTYIYQMNDIIASLKPQISPLFGYDKAVKEFKEYYDENKTEHEDNKYTDIYKGKNVIAIHAESIQNWLLGTEINGQEITPTLNKLAKEGIYFNNFYAQESVGTSSDTEFTFNTSLLPASSGTVFVSYWDREYLSIPKLLGDQGYRTFSMHANKGNFWNREVMHKQLGYDTFYYYTKDYEIDETIGLGLSDKSFFKQSVPKIKAEYEKYGKFYALLIMLTNHTPFNDIADHSTLDLTYKYNKVDPETGEETEVVNDYLEGTVLGNYIKSAHYADEALGQLLEDLDKEGLLDDTVFILYGDHDAKLQKSQYDRYYNYDPETDGTLSKDDPNYKEFTKYDYELNRKVPFIIWTKDNQQHTTVNEVMGMYDVLPTLGNMFGFESPYALGHDIFSVKDNLVPFPNGNWVTNKMYYDSQKGQGILIDKEALISSDYIDKNTEKAEKMVSVSNSIIVHDLINKIKESEEIKNGK